MAKGELPWFDFTSVPAVGLRVRYRKQFVTLIAALPYVRADGAETTLLRWRSDDGREGLTGLRCNSLTLRTPDQI